jgi:hypothetical protein
LQKWFFSSVAESTIFRDAIHVLVTSLQVLEMWFGIPATFKTFQILSLWHENQASTDLGEIL